MDADEHGSAGLSGRGHSCPPLHPHGSAVEDFRRGLSIPLGQPQALCNGLASGAVGVPPGLSTFPRMNGARPPSGTNEPWG